MKTLVMLVVVMFVLISGCARIAKKPGQAYVPVKAKESFSIGVFKPSKTEYNFKHYDEGKAIAFLASIDARFSEGDIVALDGLKWQRQHGEWNPIPNPPFPVYKKGDDLSEFYLKYAGWIDDHPHFGYPPLPMDNKR